MFVELLAFSATLAGSRLPGRVYLTLSSLGPFLPNSSLTPKSLLESPLEADRQHRRTTSSHSMGFLSFSSSAILSASKSGVMWTCPQPWVMSSRQPLRFSSTSPASPPWMPYLLHSSAYLRTSCSSPSALKVKVRPAPSFCLMVSTVRLYLSRMTLESTGPCFDPNPSTSASRGWFVVSMCETSSSSCLGFPIAWLGGAICIQNQYYRTLSASQSTGSPQPVRCKVKLRLRQLRAAGPQFGLNLSMKSKLETNSDFRSRMSNLEEKNRLALQHALYSDLSMINTDIIKHNGYDNAKSPVYIFYGDLQPKDNKLLDKLYLYAVRWFFEEFDKRGLSLSLDLASTKILKYTSLPEFSFTLVYFNTFCESSSRYDDFRNILRSMTPGFILALKNLVVVHPTLRVKTLDWIVFGTVNAEIKDKTHYADKIQKLEKYGVALQEGWLAGLRTDIVLVDYKPQKDDGAKKQKNTEAGMVQEHKAKNPRNNIEDFKRIEGEASSQYASLQKIFKKDKKSLDKYEISEMGVPLILKTLVMCLRTNQKFLEQEGIFRKSVSIEEQKEAVDHLISEDYQYLENIENPYLVATLIKRFLSNLQEPLLPYGLYDRFIALTPSSPIPEMASLFHSLPALNYATLMFVLRFFVKDIIPHQKQNKMTEYNSAVCLVPCLVWSKEGGLQDMINGKNLVNTLEVVLKHFEQVFGGEQEQTQIYRKSSRRSMNHFRTKIFQGQGEQEEDEPESEPVQPQSRDAKLSEQVEKPKPQQVAAQKAPSELPKQQPKLQAEQASKEEPAQPAATQELMEVGEEAEINKPEAGARHAHRHAHRHPHRHN